MDPLITARTAFPALVGSSGHVSHSSAQGSDLIVNCLSLGKWKQGTFVRRFW